MVAPVHNLDPAILPEGSAKLQWGGGGGGQGKEFDRFYLFLGSSEAAMGGGARSAPFCMTMSPKKTGARSARARTRGQNPLVFFVCVCVCVCVSQFVSERSAILLVLLIKLTKERRGRD